MTIDISMLVGGEAGQGIQTVGHLMTRTCHATGLYVTMLNDFESRIRTGIFYCRERPTFTNRIDKLKDRALIDYSYHAEPLREILRKHKAIG